MLDARLCEWTRDHERDGLVATLRAAGIAAAPVLGPPELLEDPHLRVRGFFQIVDRAEVGPKPYPALPIRFSKTPARIRMPAP